MPMQLPLFVPDSNWTPPSMSDLPATWKGFKRIGYDLETKDTDLLKLGIGVRRPGNFVAGISFAIEDGPAFYLPIRHEGGGNMDKAAVLKYLRAMAKDFDGILVGANINYDLDWSAEEGINFPNVKYIRDVQVAAPLIWELHMSFSLQNIANRLGFAGKDETLLKEAAAMHGIDPKASMWRLHSKFVGPYAEEDARLPLQILRKQETRIEEEDLWNIFNLESQVTPVLVKMRRRGVLIDQDQLDKVEIWSLEEETKALKLIKDETGYDIGLNNVLGATACAPALERIGITLGKTAKGQWNIDQTVLKAINHPVADAILWARKTNKLRTTFAASIRRYMIKGRIHCTFSQIAMETPGGGDQKGARYGRLSGVHPNLQQQPSRDQFASMWRSIYIPETGCKWACLDYSQQEPRWTTHFSATMKLEGACEAAKAYWDDPDLDNHQFMSDLTSLPRKDAKAVYLGLCYGEGGAKLCDDLGLPTRWILMTGWGRNKQITFHESRDDALKAGKGFKNKRTWRAAGEEGQDVIDKFDSRAPFIRKIANKAKEIAGTKGFVTTIEGRKLHFPQKEDGTHDWTHKALNRVIQGSSADQMKKAMVAIDREMPEYYMQLQVHDETDSSITDVQQARDAAQIMMDVIPAKVPFKVDIEIGPSWGEMKEIK